MSDYYHSREIVSNQEGIHPDLSAVVQKHLQNPYLKPIADHTQREFDRIQAQVEQARQPLIFDSACGVGESSDKLAQQHPEHWVIGMDQSAHRLAKGTEQLAQRENLLLLQVDCVDFWRLAQAADWQLDKHYFLYPNPWPKKHHLKRRWQGHPVWPSLLALGGSWEIRSNWSIYIQEFAQAYQLSTGRLMLQESFTPDGDYLTPFERKYASSGQALYRALTV